MAVTRKQTKVTGSSASATSLSFTFGSTPVAGNLMTIGCSGNGAKACVPPTGWSRAPVKAGNGQVGGVCYRVVVSGDTTGPYTINQGDGNAGAIAGMADEWQGFAAGTVGVIDYGSNENSGANTITSITMNTTTGNLDNVQPWANGASSDANSDLVYCVAAPGGAGGTSFTAAGGLTQDTTVTANCNIAIATPTTNTSFTSAQTSWTGAHQADMECVIFSVPVAPTDPLDKAWGAGGTLWQMYNAATMQRAPYYSQDFSQRDRRDANTVGSAVNNAPSPLDTAWQSDGSYWHRYSDWRRDWDQYRYIQKDMRDANRVASARNDFDETLSGFLPQSYWRWSRPWDRHPYIQPQRLYTSDQSSARNDFDPTQGGYLDQPYWTWYRPWDRYPFIQKDMRDANRVGSAVNDLDTTTDGDDLSRHRSWRRDWASYQWVQRAYISPPDLLSTALLEGTLLGSADDLARHRAWRRDWDRYPVLGQRSYISPPDLLGTALLEDELLGRADNERHMWWRRDWDQYRGLQRPYISTVGLLDTALLEDVLLGRADNERHAWWRRDAYWSAPGKRGSDPSLLTPPNVTPTLLFLDLVDGSLHLQFGSTEMTYRLT